MNPQEANKLAIRIGQVIAAGITVKFMPADGGNVILMSVTDGKNVRYEEIHVAECGRLLLPAFEQIVLETLQ